MYDANRRSASSREALIPVLLAASKAGRDEFGRSVNRVRSRSTGAAAARLSLYRTPAVRLAVDVPTVLLKTRDE